MAYYITGDCHANFDKLIYFSRFNRKLTENDVIILLGDVGLNYFGKEKDNVNKQILADFPNYFLCIHGNHEERPFNIPSYRMKNGMVEVYIMKRNFQICYLPKMEKCMILTGKKQL